MPLTVALFDLVAKQTQGALRRQCLHCACKKINEENVGTPKFTQNQISELHRIVIRVVKR